MIEEDVYGSNTDQIYDVCIIGSGPAGMTLATELSSSGKHICVLESGGIKKNKYADNLKEVMSVGEISIKPSSRERVFGGTSTTWAGLSSPLDEIDFVHWPITFTDLRPYYIQAEKYGFASLEEFYRDKKDEDIDLPLNYLEKKRFIASDPAWNFGEKLKSIFDKKNVELKLDSTVIRFDMKKELGLDKIEKVIIKNSEGIEKSILSKVFVIAAGGLESTRLLLASNIGNEHDQVGRYMMNHPKDNFGIVKLNRPIGNASHFFGYLYDGWSQCVGIRLNEEIQKSLGLLNSYIRLEPIFPWTDSRGVAILIDMTKRARFFLNYWKSKQKDIILFRDWNETGDDKREVGGNKKLKLFSYFFIIIHDIRSVTKYLIYRFLPKKKLLVHSLRLRNFMEMEPLPENRLTLGDETDQNGQKIPIIKMSISPLDRLSLVELHRVFGEEIEKAGIGRLESNLGQARPWPITSDASHHLGGTIMGNDPLSSIVDKNLKVHSVDNLYICSGSVFPSSGCANPTYTICALAIRLARHISTNVY